MYKRVDWSKEATTTATFRRFENDGRMLKVYLHEQSHPIKCASSHRGDFTRAVEKVSSLADGQSIIYRSRGVDTYPPTEWFFRIDKADETHAFGVSTGPRSSTPAFESDQKTSQKVYGPPGTGKTHSMMEIIKNRLAEGVLPDEICFISYTNVAANEAIERVSREFSNYQPADFPYFKTIHALATALGGLDGRRVMSSDDMKRFDKTILSSPVWTEKGKAESIKIRSIHPCLSLRSLASARKTSIREQIGNIGEKELAEAVLRSCEKNSWPHPTFESSEMAIRYWIERYAAYKRDNSFVDYDDVIRKVLKANFDRGLLRFKLLIIDEAQDCSDFMWDFLNLLISESKEVYICGDDDQAIMDGFGANSQAFLQIETTEEDRVLDKSYRLNQIHYDNLVKTDGALSVLKQFKQNRKEKTFTHNGSQAGSITIAVEEEGNPSVPLSLERLTRMIQIDPSGEWLIMAPTRATVEDISTVFINKGISHYKNNEPRYIGSGMHVHNIRVQTIHTSKGAEADNVAVVLISTSDLQMYQVQTSEIFNPTLRYVAESRPRLNLYIVKG